MKLDFAATEFFNSVSDEQKRAILENGLGLEILHDGLRFAIPIWWVSRDQAGTLCLRSGSAFLIDRGQGVIGITSAHVFEGYQEAKGNAAEIVCQLGNALFDPEAHLIDRNDDLDIVTFRICADLVGQIEKPVVPNDPPNWAPLDPAEGDFAFFAGFPAQTRGMSPTGHFFTAVPYFAMHPITRATDRQLTCRFEREKMIDFSGSGLPPPGYHIGGVSGGPMLMPTLVDQEIAWRLAGVIVEAAVGTLFEQIVAVRETFVQPNGRIG